MDVFRCLFSRGVHFVRFHHDDWRLIFSGMMTGIVLLSMMSVSEAARHLDSVQSETRVSTGRPVREGGSRSLERQTESKELRSRVQDVLHPAADDAAAASSAAAVPKTVSAEDDSIIGTPLASQQQCVDFLLSVNPAPNITVSPQELVSYYYEEGAREGIRPDVAFAQALKETGFFRYGGTVTPDQNNYCGLGTTSSQVKGAYFGSVFALRFSISWPTLRRVSRICRLSIRATDWSGRLTERVRWGVGGISTGVGPFPDILTGRVF